MSDETAKPTPAKASKPRPHKPAKPRPSTTKVGDSIDCKGKPFYMQLPDGSVVTARGTYTFQHEGTHVAVVDGKRNRISVTKR